jgi:FKBP-type peptidyl-prolyl cis-trans isomerase 2
MKVQPGSLVSLDYDVLLDSGEQIDSSAVNGPLRLRVGVRIRRVVPPRGRSAGSAH